jgi:ribosome maturation factor RimP
MSFEEVRTKVIGLVEPFLEKQGLELVHLEYRSGGRGHLCFYIDKPGGVTLDDCEAASRCISDLLDTYDPISRSYILEVSSPGVERPLTREKDYERFRGEAVQVQTADLIDGRRKFKGILEGISDSRVALMLEEGVRIEIPLGLINKAHLMFKQ